MKNQILIFRLRFEKKYAYLSYETFRGTEDYLWEVLVKVCSCCQEVDSPVGYLFLKRGVDIRAVTLPAAIY